MTNEATQSSRIARTIRNNKRIILNKNWQLVRQSAMGYHSLYTLRKCVPMWLMVFSGTIGQHGHCGNTTLASSLTLDWWLGPETSPGDLQALNKLWKLPTSECSLLKAWHVLSAKPLSQNTRSNTSKRYPQMTNEQGGLLITLPWICFCDVDGSWTATEYPHESKLVL